MKNICKFCKSEFSTEKPQKDFICFECLSMGADKDLFTYLKNRAMRLMAKIDWKIDEIKEVVDNFLKNE
jgi:reverse gyrase